MEVSTPNKILKTIALFSRTDYKNVIGNILYPIYKGRE